jgi:hypothetical protein
LKKEELRLKEEVELSKVEGHSLIFFALFLMYFLFITSFLKVQMQLVASKAQALQKQMMSADGNAHSTEQQLRQALVAGLPFPSSTP